MIKKILNIINLLILIVMIVIGVGVIGYRCTGQGIGFYNGRITLSLKGFTNTFSKEEPSEIPLIVNSHKRYDTYYELTKNEQEVYDALLKKSKDILENNDNSLDMKVSLRNFDLGLDGNENYDEIREKANQALNEINWDKVLNSLRIDYSYYFWYLYSSSFSYTEVEIYSDKGDLSKSYFEMKLKSIYSDNEESLNNEDILKVRKCYQKAKEVANEAVDMNNEEKIKYFTDFILNNTNYYNDYKSDSDIKKQWSTFISVFDGDDATLSICGGYADAFQLLCDLSGIECYTAVGYMNNDMHAWNEVYLDEQIYMVDTTNIDEGTVGEGYKLYMKPVNSNEYSIKVYNEDMNYKKMSIDEWIASN